MNKGLILLLTNLLNFGCKDIKFINYDPWMCSQAKKSFRFVKKYYCLENNLLSIKELSKNYGRIKAVDNLSLEIGKGEVFGLLGPNGSGKTTTLGIVLGAISLDGGSYQWFNKKFDSTTIRRIGSILEVPLFYPYMNAVDNLKLIADIKRIPYDGIDEVLHRVGLFQRRDSAFRTYSLGMKQRLAVGAALLGNPEVLILDEPTNGLDPQGIAEIRSLIKSIAEMGKTIILASHLLDEVQKICSHVAVLDHGKCLFSGKVDNMLGKTRMIEVASDDMHLLLSLLSTYEGLINPVMADGLVKAELRNDVSPVDINRYLFGQGVILNHLTTEKLSLEKYFLEILADKS
jgi:ABC-2 type transport system ATP-binding protein